MTTFKFQAHPLFDLPGWIWFAVFAMQVQVLKVGARTHKVSGEVEVEEERKKEKEGGEGEEKEEDSTKQTRRKRGSQVGRSFQFSEGDVPRLRHPCLVGAIQVIILYLSSRHTDASSFATLTCMHLMPLVRFTCPSFIWFLHLFPLVEHVRWLHGVHGGCLHAVHVVVVLLSVGLGLRAGFMQRMFVSVWTIRGVITVITIRGNTGLMLQGEQRRCSRVQGPRQGVPS